MKLLFKQRFFSWFDSYDIYNEEGDTVYTVKGAPSWGHRLIVCDALGNEIGTVREKVLSWLPKFEMFLGDRYIGRISKELKEVCLVDQVYVKAEDGKQTVAKYLEEVSKAVGGTVKVKRFVRFETGEGLEKKQEDFAAEVAAQMNA